MSNTIEYIFKAVDKFTSVANNINNSVSKINAGIERSGSGISALTSKLNAVGRSVGLYYLSRGVISTAKHIFSATASMERFEKGMSGILGSTQKATVLTKQLRDFAMQTPYAFDEIQKSSLKLLGVGVGYKDIIPALKTIGNVAATVGMPMERLADIYGQVIASNALYGYDLRRLRMAGIPIMNYIAKLYNIHSKQGMQALMKLSKTHQFSVEVFKKALEEMTKKGGIAYKHMEVQFKTLSGIAAFLHTSIYFLMSDFGQFIVQTFGLESAMMKLVPKIRYLVENFKNLLAQHPNLVKFFVIAASISAILVPLGLAIQVFALALGGLAVVFNPIIVGIGLVAAALVYLYKKFSWVRTIVSILKKDFEAFLFVLKKIGDLIFYVGKRMTHHFSGEQLGIGRGREYFRKISHKAVPLEIGSERKYFGTISHKAVPLELGKSHISKLHSKSDVNIHIKDKGKNVQAVHTRQSGMGDLNLGVNMSHTYID